MTRREGLFVLLSDRPFTASGTLDLYRARNDSETAFSDLKHGIDWRSARCTSEDAMRGHIPNLLPRIVLYVHGPFPLSGVPRKDGGIDVRGAEPVLTYGHGAEQRGENTCFRQFWTNDSSCMGSDGVRSGVKGTWTGAHRRCSRLKNAK